MSLKGLVDREHELEALRALVDAATAGRGGLVLVEGPAGIGKTRLLAADARGRRGARAGGAERLRLGARARLPVRRRPAAARAAARRARRVRARGAVRGWRGARAGALLPGRRRPAADPDFATLYGLYWLLVGLSQRAPLLVVVDDVHWVDVPSLRFLGFLARRVDGMRLLACGALRPAEPGTDRALLSDLALGAETLHPRPLTRPAPAS